MDFDNLPKATLVSRGTLFKRRTVPTTPQPTGRDMASFRSFLARQARQGDDGAPRHQEDYADADLWDLYHDWESTWINQWAWRSDR